MNNYLDDDNYQKLNKSLFKDLKKSFIEYQDRLEPFNERMDYIVNKISEIFGGELKWWEWPWDSDSGVPFSPMDLNADFIQLDGEYRYDDDWVSILNNGEQVEFHWLKFPTRFLFEDFEQEVIDGIEKYKLKEQEKKDKAKQQRLNKKEKKEKVLSKLTAEERKVLGV